MRKMRSDKQKQSVTRDARRNLQARGIGKATWEHILSVR
jgi:hypothetical protein